MPKRVCIMQKCSICMYSVWVRSLTGQETPGFMAASTDACASSTASYTPRWTLVKRPLAG